MHLVAAKLKNRRALVSSGQYWAAFATEEEADFLCAVMNAPCTTQAVRPLMSYGKDERDIAKHIWQLPIPKYDAYDAAHHRIVELARALEQKVAAFAIDTDLHFAASRRHIREVLEASTEGRELDERVIEMLK